MNLFFFASPKIEIKQSRLGNYLFHEKSVNFSPLLNTVNFQISKTVKHKFEVLGLIFNIIVLDV